MRKLLLSLSCVALAATAFAAPKNTVDRVVGSLPRKVASYGNYHEDMVKYQIVNNMNGKLDSASAPAKAPEATVNVNVKAEVPAGFMFEGWVVFLSEDFSSMYYFPEDPKTWEYKTNGTFELPAGTYDVVMRYQREEPIGTASMIIKEQVEVTDGMNITFDPRDATFKVRGRLTTPDGKLVSPGLEGPDGDVVEEQTVFFFENEVGLLPLYGAKFVLSAVGCMCFEMMFPSEWSDYSTLYINEVSDRYMLYANAFGSGITDGFLAVAQKAGGVHGDVIITNEGQEYASFSPDFGTSLYAQQSPCGEPWRMLPFITMYWGEWGYSISALGGYYDTVHITSPAPDFDFVAYGYAPEGGDAIAYVDWGYGPEPERVAMQGQPMFNVDGRMYTLDTHIYCPDLTFTGRDGSSSGTYYLDSPLNYYNDRCKLRLGNTVPVVSILNFQYDFGEEVVNGYAVNDFGQMGEDRTDVDKCLTDIELKIDGNTVVAPGEDLQEWMWTTNCADMNNSVFELNVNNHNPLIDGRVRGFAKARAVADWSTGDHQAPMILRLQPVDDAKGVLTDRFDDVANARLQVAAGDFPFQLDPVTEYLWVHNEPCTLTAKYSPRGTDEWADLPVAEDAEVNIPTFGSLFNIDLSGVDRLSPDGWFDVMLVATDAAGNFCEEVLSPAFAVPSLVGVETVKAHSATTVSGVKGAIVVAGAEGARAEVYTTSGAKVASTTAPRIPAAPGLYIVRVANETFKVAVR